MRPVSSLSNRIFLACTLLAVLSLGFAFSFVNARATAEAEAGLRRELRDAAALVDDTRATLTDRFSVMARLVADQPKLKAAVDTGDPPTVQPLADDFREQLDADVLLVTDRKGRVIASSGAAHVTLPALAPGSTRDVSSFVVTEGGLLQVIGVPVLLLADAPDVLGRLTVGFFLDDDFARQFHAATGAEIAFGADGRVLASSLPPGGREALARAFGAPDIASVTVDGNELLALSRPLTPGSAGDTRPMVMTLRSRTERLRFLSTLRTGLAGALVVTVLLATVLSYGVARTVTRPLSTVTAAMRDVAATGDLTRKVPLRSGPWDDADARLLASAFNTLTDSVARFQQEAAQRERLSSLGRMSTVIAHEIRNPLMIIGATLSMLRSETLTRDELLEAVTDIDGESRRLNRIVSDVLDFAKPIRFDLADASLNDICRESAAAAWADAPSEDVVLDLDHSLPPIGTDAERLRTALVNILSNARHAVEAADARRRRAEQVPLTEPGVLVRTRQDGATVSIVVEDRGHGIGDEDLAHIFDPYFTTRRAGTGLGLPIAKNIVEGLGGRITIRSQVDHGTEIRLDFPLTSQVAPSA